MKILTWNILASEWMKKSYYPKSNTSMLFNHKARFAQIYKTLQTYNADIIMLQEVMKKEYSKLKLLFEKDYIISNLKKMKWYNKVSESGNVTMLRRTLFNDSDIYHYSHEYGLQTQCKYKNKICELFNIHLDDMSIKTRYKQWNNLHDICRPDSHVIIGGDFNHQYKKNSKIYNTPGFTTHNLCPTYYIDRKMNIDNIMTRGCNKIHDNKCVWYPESIEDGFHEYGSDHLPVVINVELY